MDDNPFRQYQGTFLRTIANMLGDGKPTKEVRDRVIELAGAVQEVTKKKEFRSLGAPAHLMGTT